MNNATDSLSGHLPKSFKDLSELLPLRPINDQVDFENACQIMDRLAVIRRPTRDQRDFLETLVLLTESFDKEDNEAALAEADKVSGLELLKYIMGNTEMTQAELAKLLGVGSGAVSMILSGERSITAAHARALGKRFKVDPGAFIS